MSKRRKTKDEPTVAPAPIWLRALGYFAIVVATMIAFVPLGDAGFVSMDDPGTISQNAQLKQPGYYWSRFARGLYAPVTYTTWSALAAIARDPRTNQLDPSVFHVFNIFVHIATSLIVAAILRLLVKRDAAAIVGAMIFAVHPLQVETVAWASGLKDLLAGMFGLLAVLVHLTVARDLIRGRLRLAASVFGSVSLILALLSKPSAMTIPAVAFVLDWLVVVRPWRVVLKSLAPWFVLSIGCALIAWLAQPAFRADEIPLWARPLLVGDSTAFYLWKLIAPVRLAVCYGRIVPDLIASKWLYFAWIVPAFLFVLAFRKRTAQPIALASLLTFILAPAPMLGLFRFDYQYFSTVADHYVYVGMLGAALLAAHAFTRLPRGLAVAGSTFGILMLMTACASQAVRWRNDATLFASSVAVAPRGVLALHNLGNWHDARGEYPRAVELYKRAIAVRPHHYESMGALAGTLARMNREEESIEWFRKFLVEEGALPGSLRPKQYADHLFTFAQMRLRAGDYEEAATYFRKVLNERSDPVAERDLRIAEQQLLPTTAPMR